MNTIVLFCTIGCLIYFFIGFIFTTAISTIDFEKPINKIDCVIYWPIYIIAIILYLLYKYIIKTFISIYLITKIFKKTKESDELRIFNEVNKQLDFFKQYHHPPQFWEGFNAAKDIIQIYYKNLLS